jgi:hypothetical protein
VAIASRLLTKASQGVQRRDAAAGRTNARRALDVRRKRLTATPAVDLARSLALGSCEPSELPLPAEWKPRRGGSRILGHAGRARPAAALATAQARGSAAGATFAPLDRSQWFLRAPKSAR